jgi:diguanylate cyclase (GGDEF)-like protein
MPPDMTRDSSTPVWNRESILELLTRELARGDSSGTNLTVILARVDPLKNTNREPGESQDNIVLGEIAKRLSASVRRYDYIGRYSPRQFLILAPGWEPSNTVPLAEKLRAAVRESPIDISGFRVGVTMSLVPATSANFKSHHQDEVLRELEKSLDRAEANGGNQIESLGNIFEAKPSVPPRRRRIRVSWILAGLLVMGIAGLFVFAPSWTCAPNLVGDILDSGELPPPLPANCVLTTERPAEAIIQSIEQQREASQLELQGTVTCKILSSSSRSNRLQEQQWLGNLYADGKLQYRRHVLISASQDVPGGKLFTVEQCLIPWWRYLSQSQEYCRVQDPPWM